MLLGNYADDLIRLYDSICPSEVRRSGKLPGFRIIMEYDIDTMNLATSRI